MQDSEAFQARCEVNPRFPFFLNYTKLLLIRNYAIMKNANAVFVFGFLDKNKKDRLKGGTGFSAELTCNIDISVYLFELKQLKWFRVTSDSLQECSRPTVPSKCAVIRSLQFHLNSPAYSELLFLLQ